ncbi:DUF6850 family outer membrane beta-barrel protein [Marinilabilia rubra]|uniref:DUF6850 domain-containing protein n=1 Tax=Marinilabilia rubra TaxID=2162893 RepID=A0A2U2B969_9BACT|nr:DUF6850 family outer membrane beta-barrel protein [Marinilabilia rubra]PWD99610.1 hypothetical protein DDZ16_09185 [Marinilabilia rubra]
MKKLLLIVLFIVLFFANHTRAQDSLDNNNALPENLNRGFYIEKPLKVYRFNPADLRLWQHGDFSSIGVSGKYDEGNFKTVDEFDKNEQLSVKTESVQSLKESNWKFYGNFTMSVSRHDNAMWNLGYHKSKIGSPFRLLIQRMGDFNVKHYGLQGIANKKLNEKISIGLGIKYRGDLYFRVSDTRNEFYTLTSEFSGAINYALGDNKYLSLGASYFYRKGQPNFNNEFKTNGPEYYLYFNEGLGDFNDFSIDSRHYWKNQNPKYYVSFFTGDKNKFSISYSGFFGEEKWENKITSTLVQNAKDLYKYEYFENKLLTSHYISKEAYKLFNFIESVYISGTGYKNTGVFQKTYNYEGLDINSSSELIRPQADLFYRSSMDFFFESKSKKDMVYAHQIDYTNLSVKLKTGYRKQFNPLNALALDLEFLYKQNINFTHNVVSAGSKPYTLNLAYNEVAYHAADFYQIGGDITWFKKVKKMGLEFKLGYKLINPANIPVSNNYSTINTDTQREYLETSLEIYF